MAAAGAAYGAARRRWRRLTKSLPWPGGAWRAGQRHCAAHRHRAVCAGAPPHALPACLDRTPPAAGPAGGHCRAVLFSLAGAAFIRARAARGWRYTPSSHIISVARGPEDPPPYSWIQLIASFFVLTVGFHPPEQVNARHRRDSRLVCSCMGARHTSPATSAIPLFRTSKGTVVQPCSRNLEGRQA